MSTSRDAQGSSSAQPAPFPAPEQPATAGVRSLQEDLQAQALSLPQEQSVLAKFRSTAEHVAKHAGIRGDWSVGHIAELAGIELEAIHRESALGLALWVAWLQVTAQFMSRADLKYQCVADFLAVYVCFVGYDDAKREHLMHVANWMAYLLSKIPARKNKGFTLQVVPKLLEGWRARYITGSGQSRATEDRVKIYEVEGEVVPIQRLTPSKRGRLTKRSRAGGRKPRQGGKRRRDDSDVASTSTSAAAAASRRGEFGWSCSRTATSAAPAPIPAPAPTPASALFTTARTRPRKRRQISCTSSFSAATATFGSSFPSAFPSSFGSAWDPALSPFVSPYLTTAAADPSVARTLQLTVESSTSGPTVQLLLTDTSDADDYCIASGVEDFFFPRPTLCHHEDLFQQQPASCANEQLGSDTGTSSESHDQELVFEAAIDKELFGDDGWSLEFAGLTDDDFDIENEVIDIIT